MLRYNTQQPRLTLPEYGRNIQQMIDHCLTIENREERNRCARTIILAMTSLFPEMRETEESRHKLWDHLAIMSDFQLDIDWPWEPASPDARDSAPNKIPYPATLIKRRNYGHALEMMINRAADMPEGEERDALVSLLANQMKKCLLMERKDGIEDERVYKDLADYSGGRLRYNADTLPLHEFQISAPANGKKKKKK